MVVSHPPFDRWQRHGRTGPSSVANGHMEMGNYHLHTSHLPACSHSHEHWTVPGQGHNRAGIECAAMAGGLHLYTPACWGSCRRQMLET